MTRPTAKKSAKTAKVTQATKTPKLNTSKSVLLAAAIVAVLGGVFFALKGSTVGAEASTVVVNSTNTQAWFTGATANGGTVGFVGEAGVPFGTGALQLKTDATTAAKAQYLKTTTLPLAELTNLSYFTKTVAGGESAAPSFYLEVKLHGVADGLTTLVYEPKYNGTVTPGTWQKWDLMAGQWWSTTSIPPVVVEGNGGEPFYGMDYLKGWYEQAEVIAYGVAIGDGEPNFNVLVDGLTFNDMTFDFEGQAAAPMTKEACKAGGWRDYPELYKNQGACVSSVVKS